MYQERLDWGLFLTRSRYVTSDLIIARLFSSTDVSRTEERQGSQIRTSWELTNVPVVQWIVPAHAVRNERSVSEGWQ